jgi:S1-C subfamily serine protease
VDEGYPSVANVTEPRSSRYVAILAVTAGLILIFGWLLRPRDIPQSPPSVPSETELQELARRAQRGSLESTRAYFADVAADVYLSLGYIPSTGTSGIVWDDSHVVTGPMPIADRAAAVTVRTASGERSAEVTSSRRLPLSHLEVTLGPPGRMPRRAASLPQVGDWILVVWQTDQAPAFAAANFRQIASTTCGIAHVQEFIASIPLTGPMTGGGIFDMDGELLAVVLPCGNRVAAIESASVDDIIKRVGTVEERLLARYGVLFSSISPEERHYFSATNGLLVRELWMRTRADAAGFQAGDVVVALNDHPLTGIDDLRPLTATSEAAFELSVLRGSKTQTITFDTSAGTPGVLTATDAGLGVVLESPTAAFRIQAVLPDSRAAHAGVEVGDILRRINSVEPRTRAQADRAVRGATSKPILLEVERGRRRLAIVIPEGTAP